MTRSKLTSLAWIAPIWFLANTLIHWVISSFFLDWWCGMPFETCRSGELHPLFLVYIRLSFAGMVVLTVAAGFLAVRGRLTKAGLVGLLLAIALIIFFTVITLTG